ncbi:hypothetical protein [Paenibacillus sp. FSL E2-0178]|uniref:hypothetical protein n=1 Tax=Paenibacillus sp. FSL E2-0178 TaxID=2921361 RepID=UPI0031582175
MQPTYGNFEVRGIVTGMLNSKAYSVGDTQEGQWNRIQFGVRVSNNAFVYVELMGNKTSKLKMFKVDPMTKKYDKNNYIMVSWDEKYSQKYKRYKYLQPVKINLLGFETEDVQLIGYDAAEYLRDNLKDGTYILIKGSLRFNDYKGDTQESFNINEIYVMDGSELSNEAYFAQEIIYVGIEDINRSKCKVNSKMIIRNFDGFDIIPYSFIINNKDSNMKSVFDYFKENIQMGSTLKVHGLIRNYVPITWTDEGQEIICGSAIKELEITGGNTSSLIQARYKPEELESNVIQGSPFEDNSQKQDRGVNKFGF